MRILVLGHGKTGKLVAEVANMRACLAIGAKMVIGTTGWYDKLPDMKSLAERRDAGLLYGTNFSIGVQLLMELSKKMSAALKDAGYTFSIAETHHSGKLDSPSGTALTLRDAVLSSVGTNTEVVIHATRTGDIEGIHSLIATGPNDVLTLTHESKSRRPFAEGAVRAAEWLSTRTGVYDLRDVFEKF
jgi:4-hydroxy-tetrahydrodipicolinate reductase